MVGPAIALIACPQIDDEIKTVLTGLLLGITATGATCLISRVMGSMRARKQHDD